MLFLLATTLLARAADLTSLDVPELVDTPDGPREVHYKLVTELEIDGVTLKGVLIGPDIAIGSEVRHGEHQSQVRLRANFDDHLAWSAEAVR